MSTRLKRLPNTPVIFKPGYLYFCVRPINGPPVYFRARGKRVSYWLSYLLNVGAARDVTVLNPQYKAVKV